MKKVLVTGASGFIGRHCLGPLIERGFEVHGVFKKGPLPAQKGTQWHQSDLLDSDQVRTLVSDVRPSHLLHLAWHTAQGDYWNSLENVNWLRAGTHLLQEFAVAGGQRLVTVGTCAEYDRRYGYLSERTTPLVPSTLYGACKLSLEQVQQQFADRAGMDAAWARIFYLYGPHEKPERLVASVIMQLLEGRQALCSHGLQIRDYLYVEDVGEALAAILDSNVSGAINVASGQPVTLKDLVLQIAGKLGRPELVRFGALPAHEDEPPFVVGDARRLISEVGWIPRIELDKGLERTIAWWRNRTSQEPHVR